MMSTPDRRALLDRDHAELSIRRQCALLGLARSGVYRPAAAANENDLALVRRLDELLQRLMRRMGIAALGPKPRTMKPAPGHKIFPYLCCGR